MTIPSPAQILLSETRSLVARIKIEDKNKTQSIDLKISPLSAKMSKKHPEDMNNARIRQSDN